MSAKLALALLALSLSFNTLALAEADPNFYIFLCFGQSNMEGNAKVEDQDKLGVDKRFQVLATVDSPNLDRKKGNWYPADPPLCRAYTGICPADYFGRTMVANLPPNIRVGVINVSVAGSSIELFDKEHFQTYAKTVPDWMTNMIKEYNGNPYGHLVEMAKLAQKDGVIKGILLHQGETNCGDPQWPAKVKGIYDNLINDLGLKPESVPLLAGELVNADQNGACAGMNAIIAELPKTIPNAHVISSSGCAGNPDHLHFMAAGYRELGKRYAQKMLTLMGYQAAELKQPATPASPEPQVAFGLPSFSARTTSWHSPNRPRDSTWSDLISRTESWRWSSMTRRPLARRERCRFTRPRATPAIASTPLSICCTALAETRWNGNVPARRISCWTTSSPMARRRR